jgi:TonB family protein
VYAQALSRPSVAAPTAGLHVTGELLQTLRRQDVGWTSVELQVGLGTFKPVETQWLDEHPMHSEWCRIEQSALDAVLSTRSTGGRVIAVGTTSVRVLESLPVPPTSGEFDTRLMISPGHGFRLVDGLLTNFHLPRSTLLALVGAMVGLERLKSLYAEAQREGWEGRSSVAVQVDPNGTPTGCEVVRSSGHAVLDEATCRTVVRRVRFDPARDRQGRAVSGIYRPINVRWQLPPESKPLPEDNDL